jgi:hypothetical protein
MLVRIDQAGSELTSVHVTGTVRMIAQGTLDADLCADLAHR